MKIAEAFGDRWNFPDCLGAINGKHSPRYPIKSDSYYLTHKSYPRITCLFAVDNDYKLIFIDVGCNGRISDGGVFRDSLLSEALSSYENPLGIPAPRDVESRRKIL